MKRLCFQLVWGLFMFFKGIVLALGLALLPVSGLPALAAPQLATFNQLEGKFKQKKLLQELDLEIKTEGRFQVLRPKTAASVFYWNIEVPKASKICIDGEGIVMNGKNLKFSEVGDETAESVSGLLKIMTMDPSQLEADFAITQRQDKLQLKPKKPETSLFASADLTLNRRGLVDEVVIYEKSKDRIHIQFSNLKTNSQPLTKEVKCPR